MKDMFSSSDNHCHFSLLFGGLSPEHPASIASFDNLLADFKQHQALEQISSIFYFTKNNDILYNRCTENKSSVDYIETGEHYDLLSGIKKLAEENTFHINLLHGNLGEDGHIQGIAKYLGFAGTYGRVLPSALAMSKHHMAHCVRSLFPAVNIPESICLHDNKYESCLSLIKNRFTGCDIVIKPNALGASLFTHKYTMDDTAELAIITNIKNIFEYDHFALIQKFVSGREYSVGCLNLPEGSVALDVIEVTTPDHFFGHDEKHKINQAEERIITKDSPITLRLKAISLEIFDAIGFEYMCRFDFIVTAQGNIYFLEANPIPGLMKNSLFPKMLNARNLSISQLFPLFNRLQKDTSEKETLFDYVIE